MVSLFPQIERLSGLKFIEKVGLGTNEAAYVQDARGRVWVRKLEEMTGFQPLLAECLGWLLGSALGVPIPPAAVCLDPTDGRAWLSLRVDPVLGWDRVHANNIVNYPGLGAAAALDLIVMNGDRNNGNLLLAPEPDQAHLKVWAIDAGDAGIGYHDSYAESVKQDELPNLKTYARGLPVNVMREGAAKAAERASKLPEARIRAMVDEACQITAENKAAEIAAALRERCMRAPKMLPGWLDLLEKHQ